MHFEKPTSLDGTSPTSLSSWGQSVPRTISGTPTELRPQAKRRKMSHHALPLNTATPFWRAMTTQGGVVSPVSDMDMMVLETQPTELQRVGSDVVKNMPFENRTFRAVLDECEHRGVPITRTTKAELLRKVSNYWS